MKSLIRGGTTIIIFVFACYQAANSFSASVSADFSTAAGTMIASANILAPPMIVDHSPPSNGLDVDRTATISVTFDVDMNASSIDASTFVVNGALSGRHSGVIAYDAPTRTAEYTPQTPFAVGEVVAVTLTRGIYAATGDSLASPYVWTFTARVEGGTGKFDFGPTLPVAGSPLDVAAGDFNNDGLFDIVTANLYADNVSVIFNNGDSTLVLDSIYATGSYPAGLCTGDFDADGSIDFAVAENGSNDVAVFLNTGNGTFLMQTPVAAGAAPRSMAPIDVDGDGDLDLAVANTSSKDIAVLLNDGAGVFALDSIYTVGATVFYISSADLDLDGSIDLVIAGSNTNEAYALFNNGDGIYSAAVPYPSANHPRGTAAADFDGDGYADIATADDWSYVVSVFSNQGDGTFGDNSIYSTGVHGPFVLTSGDLDADGDIDIATANGGYASTSIMINAGDGTFTLDRAYQAALSDAYGIAQADMDGDGDLDIVMSSIDPSQVLVIYNEDLKAIDSTHPRPLETSVPLDDSIMVFFRAPINQVTMTDSALVVRSRASGIIPGTIIMAGPSTAVFKPDQPFLPGDKISVTVTDHVEVISEDRLIKSRAWTFSTAVQGGIGSFQTSRQFAVDESPQALCVADLNDDGLQDVATISTDRNVISLLINNGDSTFTRDTAGAVDRLPYDIAAADLDDDGDLDLVTACLGDSSVVICYNDGTGKCESTSRFAEGIRTSSVAVADFDKDGHPDIAAAKVYSESTYVYINNGAGGFSAPGVPYYMQGFPLRVSAVDIDSDGDEDLVSVPYSDHHFVSVLFNDGFGGFYRREIKEAYPSDSGDFADSTHSIYAGDLDGDGFADLAVGNVRLDNISILMNDSSGAFSSVTVYDLISQPHSIFGGDFDGDGDVDLAVADKSVPGDVTIMENAGDGTFGNLQTYAADDGADAVIGADIDGDGDMDILTANGGANDVSVLFNRDTAYVESLPIPDTVVHGDSCQTQVKVLGDPDDVLLHYRLGGETAWTDTVLQSSDSVYQCKIATDVTGLRSTGYFFEINQLEVTKTLPTTNAATAPYYVRSELSDVLTPDLQDSVYLMIGFPFDINPGQPAAVFEDDFGTYDILKWRLGRWNPDIPGYEEYPALDSIRRCNGYWLHNRTGAHLDASGLSALPDTVIDDTAYARIDLLPGWNQIATPFDFPVSWSHRRINTDIDAVINAYVATDTGSYYYTTDTLLPFHGYFLYSNASGATPLFLPYIRANLLPPPALLPIAPRHDFWQAQLSLEADGVRDATNTFGVRPQAADGRDKFDLHEPPLPPGKYVSLCFERTGDDGETELLSGDFREPRQGWMFNLLIRGNTGGTARLRLTDTLLFPPDYAVVLVDTVSDTRSPIPRTGTLSLPRVPTVEGTHYRLIVGDKAYVDSHGGSDVPVPAHFRLYQNHPNPFNPATTINFDLPAPAHVRLDIFNILGQRVRTLLDRAMPAGTHAVRWDGRDGDGRPVASGVYFYRLDAGRDVAKRKMILLK
jgi:hypothetical protein